MKTGIAILLSVVLLCGCATPAGEKLGRVSLGMSKAQVIEVMGQPGSTTATGGKEILRYPMSAKRVFTWDFDEYCVVLEGGKVASYGRASELDLPKPSN